MKIIFSALMAAACLYACPLAAEQLIVTDCSGAIRALSNTEAGALSQVVVLFEKAAGATVVSLSSVSFTDTRNSTTIDGKAAFKDIAPGSWKVCPAEKASLIESVSIISQADSGIYTSEVVLGSVGVVGLAAATGLSLGAGSSGANEPTLLTGSPGGTLPEPPKVEAAQHPVAAARQTLQGRREACLTDARPAALSPFL